jgi:hypothetical protein
MASSTIPIYSLALLALTGSRLHLKSESNLCYDRQPVGQCVLMSSPVWGPRTNFCYCQRVAGLLTWGALSGDNFCWPSSEQSFWGNTFYCLRFETPPTWRVRSPYLYPTGTGWRSYTPWYWVPSSLPPTTHRATVEVFEPASTRVLTLTNFLTAKLLLALASTVMVIWSG